MTHSSVSSESEIIHKLGFENQIDNRSIYALILNRMRDNFTFLPIILEIISYIQICAIGFYSTVPGIFCESSYTYFLDILFEKSLDLSTLIGGKDDRNKGHIYLIIFYAVVLFIWIIFYIIFIFQYKTSQTYKPIIINTIYYVGYHVVTVISCQMGTTYGYFLRNLFIDMPDSQTLPTFFTVILVFSYICIVNFIVKVIHSSPTVNSNNPFCLWPHHYYPLLYRQLVGLILPIVLELLRGNSQIAEDFGYMLNIITGAIGFFLLWKDDENVFPCGRIILSIEYVILIVASLLSLIFVYLKINSLYYLLIFIILIIGIGIALWYINCYQIRRSIDLLYLPITELVEHITTPQQCIHCIKKGLLYKVPCIQNFKLQDWAISVWPTHKTLLLFISYVSFLFHMPHLDILDLISRAVSISPLNDYDRLLYYQLYNHLPIHEQLLRKKLNSIRKLYELPITSLKNFWRAVLVHHWDEAVMKSISLHKETDRISAIFSKFIFEHPYSECITREFAQFTIKIQGNYALARMVEKELETRLAFIQMIMNEKQSKNIESQDPNKPNSNSPASFDSGSLKFSNLSSLNSSIFLSDFAEVPKGFDKSQSEIQSAVNARPIFWPTNFFISTTIISFISLAVVISTFVVSNIESTRLDNQIHFASRIHQFAHVFTRILYSSLEFSTAQEPTNMTVSGTEKNISYHRNLLNDLTHEFGELLVEAFKYQPYLPKSSLEFWIKNEVTTYILFPIEKEIRNMTIMEALRIYQIKARTLAFSPADHFGTIENPCREIFQVSYLYPTVSTALNAIMQVVCDVSKDEIDDNRLKVYLTVGICMGVSFLVLIILAPIVIVGLIHEFDFFVSLYSMVPGKNIVGIIQKNIEVNESPAQHNNNNNNNSNAEHNNININNNNENASDKEFYLEMLQYNRFTSNDQSNKKIKLPLNLYHVDSMIAIFLCVFIIVPLPFVIIILTYLHHVDESHFILNGLQLSSEMITSFGLLSLYGFRLISGFPSYLTAKEEAEMLLNAADLMLSKYSELYFGGTDSLPKGLLSRNENEKISLIWDKQNDCEQLSGYGIIQHDCTPTHENIYFLYGLVKRIVESEYSNDTNSAILLSFNSNQSIKNSLKLNEDSVNASNAKGVTSRMWRLFYPVASDLLENSIKTIYEVLFNIAQTQRKNDKILSIASLIIGIIFFILAMILTQIYTKYVLTKSFKSLLKPIVVMNPSDVVESPFLLRFLQGDFDFSSRNSSLLTHSKSGSLNSKNGNNINELTLMDFMVEGILIMTADGTIIASNKKYHEMFCNTPEEVIGSSIHSIFIQNLNPLCDALNDIKNGKGNFEQNISMKANLFAEDGRELEMKVSLVARLNQNQRGGKSTVCALIFTDESDLIKTQNHLKHEKENIEMILDSFLPHNLVTSLLSDKSYTSFEVEKACVLYSSLIFPPEISANSDSQLMMKVLNLIYTKFDSELLFFGSITKLRMSDNLYVCAAGLFKEDGLIEKYSIDIISLALRLREVIFNGIMINESKVKIKIGIYTGGPLICGVVGRESPSFEVFGKAMNLACELEKSALDNQIHISQLTADLIQSLKLELVERPNDSSIPGIEESTWTLE